MRFMPGLVVMCANIQGGGSGDSDYQLNGSEGTIKSMAAARAGFVGGFDLFEAARAVGSSFHQNLKNL